MVHGRKKSLYKCDVLQLLTHTHINRTSCRHVLCTSSVAKYLLVVYNLEFFHEHFYLKQNFENPRIFISLKIINPTVIAFIVGVM